MTTVIIPARNEAPRIAHIVRKLYQLKPINKIIVCNNGSTDNTRENALAANAVVVNENRIGYGAACLAGLKEITEPVDNILFINADGAEKIDEATTLIDALRSQNADLVVGSRTLGHAEKGALLPQQRFGNWLACILIQLFSGSKFTDLGPYRVIKWPLLKRLNMSDKDYGWIIEMQLKAISYNAKIVEVPVTTFKSAEPSKISGTLHGLFGASYKILYSIFRYGFKKMTPSSLSDWQSQNCKNSMLKRERNL